MTGAEAAHELLTRAGVSGVAIEPARGMLTDHYNPATKKLALSIGVFNSTSVAAVGIASHEAGHAIQHADHYGPLWLRSALVPTASFGSSIGYIVMLTGLMLASSRMVWIGALLFSAVIAFQLASLYSSTGLAVESIA